MLTASGRTYVRFAKNPLYEIFSGLRAQGLTLSSKRHDVQGTKRYMSVSGVA